MVVFCLLFYKIRTHYEHIQFVYSRYTQPKLNRRHCFRILQTPSLFYSSKIGCMVLRNLSSYISLCTLSNSGIQNHLCDRIDEPSPATCPRVRVNKMPYHARHLKTPYKSVVYTCLSTLRPYDHNHEKKKSKRFYSSSFSSSPDFLGIYGRQ